MNIINNIGRCINRLGANSGKAPGLPATLRAKFLFLWTGKYDGDNLLSDLSSDVITVTGKDWVGSIIPPETAATFHVPDNATYLAADDTDDFWFNVGNALLQKTHANLIASTTARTFIKYADFEPYNVSAIGILKPGEVITINDLGALNKFFKLWVEYWGLLMDNGYMKDNRTFLEEKPNEFILEIVTTAPNTSITIPHIGSNVYNYSIDYGDGSALGAVTSSGDTDCTHIYADAGTYEIKISGICEDIFINNSGTLRLAITKVLSWGKDLNFKNIRLYGCSNLTEVAPDYHKAFATITTSFGITSPICFRGCTSLTSIPSGLLLNATSCPNFSLTFAATGLTSIPQSLLRYCTSAGEFSSMFKDCTALVSIPYDLFRYNPVNYTGFQSVFEGCTGIISIPDDMFRYNTNVQLFRRIFYGCSALASIPSGLFKYNLQAISFEETFNGCIKLQLNSTIFYSPEDIGTRFLNKSVSFLNCFARTSFTGNQGTAPDLWNCVFGTGTPVITNAFDGAGNSLVSLNNYEDIPISWV